MVRLGVLVFCKGGPTKKETKKEKKEKYNNEGFNCAGWNYYYYTFDCAM